MDKYQSLKNILEQAARSIKQGEVAAILILATLASFCLLLSSLAIHQGFEPLLREPQWKVLIWALLILTSVFFLASFILILRRPLKDTSPPPLSLSFSAYKGLWPYNKYDAAIYSRLQRDDILKGCLKAISSKEFRFGVLLGESGAGKSSFLQAGLEAYLSAGPGKECLYIALTEQPPLVVIRNEIARHLGKDRASLPDNFLDLMEFATRAKPAATWYLLIDQFEQFYVHNRRKGQQEQFHKELARWYKDGRHLDVKLMLGIRRDSYGHMVELKREMQYMELPDSIFTVEKFEPERAAKILETIASEENILHNPAYLRIMAEQLADSEGLVSPVELQILCILLLGFNKANRAFTASALESVGGLEGLLDRYLSNTLGLLSNSSMKRAALEVLSALVNWETWSRDGFLSISQIRAKLGNALTLPEVEESVKWLSNSNIRLVIPALRPEDPDIYYQLSHEKLIASIRKTRQGILNEAEAANRLLDSRTSEWAINGREKRSLLGWAELRSVKKQEPHIDWGHRKELKSLFLLKSEESVRKKTRLTSSVLGGAFLIATTYFGFHSSDHGLAFRVSQEFEQRATKLSNATQATVNKSITAIYFEDGLGAVDERLSFFTDPKIRIEAYLALASALIEAQIKAPAELILEKVRMERASLSDMTLKKWTTLSLVSGLIKIGKSQEAWDYFKEFHPTFSPNWNSIQDQKWIAEVMALAFKEKQYQVIKSIVKMFKEDLSSHRFLSDWEVIFPLLNHAMNEKERITADMALELIENVKFESVRLDMLAATAYAYQVLGDSLKARETMQPTKLSYSKLLDTKRGYTILLYALHVLPFEEAEPLIETFLGSWDKAPININRDSIYADLANRIAELSLERESEPMLQFASDFSIKKKLLGYPYQMDKIVIFSGFVLNAQTGDEKFWNKLIINLSQNFTRLANEELGLPSEAWSINPDNPLHEATFFTENRIADGFRAYGATAPNPGALEKAIESSSRFSQSCEAHFYLACAFFNKMQREKGREHLKRANRLADSEESDADLLWILSDSLMSMGNSTDAGKLRKHAWDIVRGKKKDSSPWGKSSLEGFGRTVMATAVKESNPQLYLEGLGAAKGRQGTGDNLLSSFSDASEIAGFLETYATGAEEKKEMMEKLMPEIMRWPNGASKISSLKLLAGEFLQERIWHGAFQCIQELQNDEDKLVGYADMMIAWAEHKYRHLNLKPIYLVHAPSSQND